MMKKEFDELEKLAPTMPEKFEFEPGKFAIYDSAKHCYIYKCDGEETVIRL